jgi:hypothetical protein
MYIREWLGRVHSQTRAIEALGPHAVGVEVAAVLVADAVVALAGGAVATFGSRAPIVARLATWVRRVRGRHFVGFPYVYFRAACAVLA